MTSDTPRFQTRLDGSVVALDAMSDVLMISFDLLESDLRPGFMKAEGPFVEIAAADARYLYEITERDQVGRVARAELRRVDRQ